MDKQRVIEALNTLRAELADARRDDASLDDESSRAALELVTADVQRMLERDEPLEEGDLLSGRLTDAVQEFGAEHPQLSGALNQVAAALANLGI